MNRHYILSINPQANYEWERCVLRNPITGQHPNLTEAITQCLATKENTKLIEQQAGSHLVKVSINVEILETVPHFPESMVKVDSSMNMPVNQVSETESLTFAE